VLSTDPLEIRIGVSASSITASASACGRRQDSICGVAPAFHSPKAASRKPEPFGRAIETTSPNFTPALASPRAIWLVRRSKARQVTVWAASVMAGASGFSAAIWLMRAPKDIEDGSSAIFHSRASLLAGSDLVGSSLGQTARAARPHAGSGRHKGAHPREGGDGR